MPFRLEELPGQQQPQRPTDSGLRGVMQDPFARTVLQQAQAKSGTVAGGRFWNALDSYMKLQEPTVQEREISREEREKKEVQRKVETFITNLENMYFNNQLHYGPQKGIIKNIETFIRPGTALDRYKNTLHSQAVKLAKQAGDVGNIAWQEQLAQIKAFPGARWKKQDAIKQFKTIRKNLDLPERKYSDLGEKRVDELLDEYGL